MASSSSSAQDRDHQLLEVGKQCSHASCLLVDFLPFKCNHCELSFCQEHFKVDAHKCSKYDENKYNRVAPNCPICNIPVAVRPGQDPNVRMEIHLETECSVVTGKVKTKSTPTCARGNCKKVLFSPIRCDKCKAQFCAAHRFPQDHNCSTITAQSKSSGQFGLGSLNTGVRNAAAVVDAVKKTSTAASSSRAVQPSTSSSTKLSLPFSKTDRRARSERESRIKAMQARAKKGLLSEEEKVILASELAAIDKRDSECVIM